MNTNEKYKPLEDNVAPPPYESAHQSFGIVDNNVNTTIEYASYKIASFPKKLLKPWKAMRYMALVELILAVGFIIFGSACLGTSVTALSRPGNHHVGYCLEASGIWVGVLCTVTGALGLGALGIPTGRRCLLVSYFVMSVISTIGCGILLIFSSIWAAISYPSYIENGSGFYLAIFIFNLILVVTSLVHFIISIVSSSFICYNWNCCCRKPMVTIVQEGNVANPQNV